MKQKTTATLIAFVVGAGLIAGPVQAADEDTAALAKAAQNPIANMISLPLQNNWNFNVGPEEKTQYLLNIQPVYPISVSESWNLINRAIVPLIDQPPVAAGGDSESGLGDIQYQGFFSPKAPTESGVIWGIGPVFSLPTA